MDQFLVKVSIMLVPGLMAITCHEVAHGFIADRFGDKTARLAGRLTLNPLKHIDIIGTLMLFIVHFGWAKPVPINYRNLRHPKRDMIWIAACGPCANFLLALISAIALRVIVAIPVSPASTAFGFVEPLIHMMSFSIYVNILLGAFNLFPIPPLDGGRVAVGLLPYRQAVAYSRIEPFGFFIVILLLMWPGSPVFPYILAPALHFGVTLLAGPVTNIVYDSMVYISSLPSLWDVVFPH